jgi:hypothetical protein
MNFTSAVEDALWCINEPIIMTHWTLCGV